MVEEYLEAGVDPRKVWPQSFRLNDVVFWINETPEFANRAVFLDESPLTPETTSLVYMDNLRAQDVQVLAPAI